MDQHKLWRRVRANYQEWDQEAPEGCEARVLVYVAGREAPVEVGRITTDRDDPDYPWVALSAPSTMRLADPDGTPDKSYPDDQLVFVHESAILRVEIVYVRRGAGEPRRGPIGFTFSEDAPDADAT